jgi:hypothetical protein
MAFPQVENYRVMLRVKFFAVYVVKILLSLKKVTFKKAGFSTHCNINKEL